MSVATHKKFEKLPQSEYSHELMDRLKTYCARAISNPNVSDKCKIYWREFMLSLEENGNAILKKQNSNKELVDKLVEKYL